MAGSGGDKKFNLPSILAVADVSGE